MDKLTSRRDFLVKCLQVPVGGSILLTLAACGSDSGNDTALVCADESKMDASELSLRKTLQYTEKSPDPNKTCSQCEFFTPIAGGAGCGTCEMFVGKQANPNGYCVSWSVDPEEGA